MNDETHANALIHQTSPYLLQHAHNPVHWYPWGEEALARARAESKPILLSIGYSACHWCHVMAHESFEDAATAELMNRHFVNIKVDREERPDLDKIYQLAHQLLTRRSGGWPLTMFLHPDDHVPFFGGTYFPPASRHGMPAFRDLLQRVADFYRQEQNAIRKQNQSLVTAMEQIQDIPPAGGSEEPDDDPVRLFTRELAAHFDSTHGGFGSAPKFPHPANLETLLHHIARLRQENGDCAQEEQMAFYTLEKMALGGIFDHVGGGFFRYSVDDQWMIPHFEKMLYDNALLIGLYSKAWKTGARPLFRDAALLSADWLMREMQSGEGGYCSSIDADADGVEGGFYVWTPEEVRSLLGEGEYDLFAGMYGLDRAANFEGRWHLHARDDDSRATTGPGLADDGVRQHLARARRMAHVATLTLAVAASARRRTQRSSLPGMPSPFGQWRLPRAVSMRKNCFVRRRTRWSFFMIISGSRAASWPPSRTAPPTSTRTWMIMPF